MRLESPVLDIRKYNIGFEAAARGAYFLVATGPWTRNSIEAAIANLRGMPIPGVIAFGDCATGKSPFRHSYAVNEKARKWLKSFGFIVHEVEGCPPNPFLAERKLLAIDMQDLTRR